MSQSIWSFSETIAPLKSGLLHSKILIFKFLKMFWSIDITFNTIFLLKPFFLKNSYSSHSKRYCCYMYHTAKIVFLWNRCSLEIYVAPTKKMFWFVKRCYKSVFHWTSCSPEIQVASIQNFWFLGIRKCASWLSLLSKTCHSLISLLIVFMLIYDKKTVFPFTNYKWIFKYNRALVVVQNALV